MKYRKGQRVRVKIPVWLARKNDLVSTEFEGTIEIATARAIFIEGTAVIRKSHNCLKCGITIKNPVSVYVGYGPECSRKLGIPRDFSPEDVPRIIETTKANVKTWLPLSQTKVELLDESETDSSETASDPEPEAEAYVERDLIIVRVPFEAKDELKAIFGAKWNPLKKAWTFPVEEITAFRIDFILSQYTAKKDEEFTRLANAGRKEIESRQRAAEFKNNENLPDVPVTRFPAWKHQKQAFWFAKDMRAAALLMDMGTGKTKVTIDLIQNRNHRSTLIICPRSVVAVWPKEFKKHLADPESIEVVALDKGSVAQKAKKAQETMEKAEKMGKSVAVVINYESAWREPFATWAKEAGFEFVVVDESHRIKSPSGKASRFCAEIGKRVKYRLALTGTPMPHSPLDVYAQYRFLDPTIFGTNFHRFKTRYAIFDKLPNGGEIVRSYINMDELHEKMYSIAYRVTKEDIQDILNLPDAVHVQRYCELSSKATRLYRQMEDDFYADVESGEVTATNALTRLLRLQQMTSGFVRTDEGEDVQIDTSKEELLSDILEDIDVKTPVVVFARFQHDLDTIRRVAEKQGRKYAELSGRMSTLKEWQEGQYDLIGVQLQAGGVGIDLTRANIAIYYSMGFNMGDYEQSLARIHRPGQTKKCTYIHLIAERTVDEKVYNALSQRKNVVESVLRG